MDEVRNSVLLVGANRAEFPVHEELMSLLERFVKTGEVVPESMLILSPPVVGGGVDATMTSHQALFDFGLTECLGGWWMIPSMLHVFLGPEVTLSQAVHVGCRIGVGGRVYRMVYLVSTSSAVSRALQQITTHSTDLHYDVLDHHVYPSTEAAAFALPSLKFRARL